MNTRLTPYDKGYVLEPKAWPIHKDSPGDWTGEEENAFGRVDFDNDEGGTDFAGLRILPAGSTRGGVPIAVPSIEFSTGEEVVEIRCIDESTRIKVAFQQPLDTLERSCERAQRAIDIVADSGEDDETQLKDVITDLLHWARVHDVAFEDVVDAAWHTAVSEMNEWAAEVAG